MARVREQVESAPPPPSPSSSPSSARRVCLGATQKMHFLTRLALHAQMNQHIYRHGDKHTVELMR